MPKINISRSIEIKASASTVFSLLNNFDKWKEWSPWIVIEPDATVTVAEGKKYFQWQGKRIGSGNMKILSERENEYVDCDLNFLKPFKSHATARFELKTNNDSVLVTWSMDSQLPFFLFFIKKMMEAYISSDYDRGLNMLKALSEKGVIPSKVTVIGKENFQGCKIIGMKSSCNIEVMKTKMSEDFSKTWAFVSKDEGNLAGEAITLYHKFDLVNDSVTYTSGFTVKKIPTDLPDGLVSEEIPNTSVFTIEHTGAYTFLGNVWSTLYSMGRNKEFKINKKIPTFEVYLNDPATTPENELITKVCFPIK